MEVIIMVFKAIAELVAQYLNDYRTAQGTAAVTRLSGLTGYAEYRSRQIISDFSHNTMDYAISHSDQFTPEQRARIRHVLLYSPLIPGPKAVQEADTRSAPDGLMKLPIRTAK